MKKVENFTKALINLQEIYKQQPPYDVITQTGMVSLFAICFEQSWKAMKECLEFSGYSEAKTGSPRAVIKLAYQAGMIKDEALWLAALNSRNQTSHTYSNDAALAIIKDSKDKYVSMFENLLNELQKNWVSG